MPSRGDEDGKCVGEGTIRATWRLKILEIARQRHRDHSLAGEFGNCQEKSISWSIKACHSRLNSTYFSLQCDDIEHYFNAFDRFPLGDCNPRRRDLEDFGVEKAESFGHSFSLSAGSVRPSIESLLISSNSSFN